MRVSVVIVGAGPGGLAMSHELTGAGIDHVVLERGEVANSWRHERWDSLRLLTPNWMTVLPGARYRGHDPHGYMTAADAVALFEGYRAQFEPPVLTGVTVTTVRREPDGFAVLADQGQWRCDAIVAATGGSSQPRLPPFAAELPRHIDQITALQYQRPGQFADAGAVLVVGASASGVQIADELARAGRAVTISVGEHVRLPRIYRGRDIYWWLDCIGQLDERYDEVDDISRARRHASVQLVGTDERRDLDLNALQAAGVRIVGRCMGLRDATAQCSGSLTNLAKNADLKATRLLRRIDEFVADNGLASAALPSTELRPTDVRHAPTELDLSGFANVIWATGYRPAYSWLPPEAFDARGRVRHDGGVAALPGLYLLGLPFLRHRRSNLISGLGADAAELLPHLCGYLDAQVRPRSGAAGGQQRAARPQDDVLLRTYRAGSAEFFRPCVTELTGQDFPGLERHVVKD
jgi:putative flavoprotein involved in K+ transport